MYLLAAVGVILDNYEVAEVGGLSNIQEPGPVTNPDIKTLPMSTPKTVVQYLAM